MYLLHFPTILPPHPRGAPKFDPVNVVLAMARNELRRQLHTACRRNDLASVARLLTIESLNADDITNGLKGGRAGISLSLVRLLLQNGPDAGVFLIRDIPRSEESHDLLRLLAEYGYDFKLEGHRILQSVATVITMERWRTDESQRLFP